MTNTTNIQSMQLKLGLNSNLGEYARRWNAGRPSNPRRPVGHTLVGLPISFPNSCAELHELAYSVRFRTSEHRGFTRFI